MKISLSNNGSLSEFCPVPVSSLEEFASLIVSMNWSSGIFKDDHRTKANFIEAHCMGLDIDEGMTLYDALQAFKFYQHIIGTTKSHQVEKHGVVNDRFRVIIFFDKPITDQETWDATWHQYKATFPCIDAACKDPSRFYYPCQEIISIGNGSLLTPVLPTVKEKAPERTEIGLGDEKGALSRSTLDFLVNGAPGGSWNVLLFKAALDFNEQGYSIEEFWERAEKVTGYLDSKDKQTIDSAFSRSPKYEPRLTDEQIYTTLVGQDLVVPASALYQDALDYLGDKHLVKGEPTNVPGLDKMLGGGKRLGELTIWHAEAKTGKNTFWHYLMCLWFDKGIKQGYASRELRPAEEVIPDFLSVKTGLNVRLTEVTEGHKELYREILEKCPIYFAKGYGLFELAEIKAWVKALKAEGVQYFWFDHLHYMLEDPEEHKLASKLIKELKTLVIEENIHIDLIIQPNKLGEGQKLGLNSIKGGSAMGQAMDNLLILERSKEHENVMKISIDRARSKLARIGHIHVKYDPETMTFCECSVDREKLPEPPLDDEFGSSMMGKVYKL